MILQFPDLDTLRLTITTGLVPEDIVLAPARLSSDASGLLFLETDAKLPRKSAEELKRLKVVPAKRHAVDPPKSISCWLEAFPATRDADPPRLSAQAPVLFELGSPDLLPTLVGEMLRLGNDRQSFRVVAVGDDTRVLLRVIGPPYYTLLRALDQLGGPGESVRAYAEAAPRVWVELGHTHEFAGQVRPPEEQLLLIRAPADWMYLPDASFQDVYDLLHFQLPSAPTEWRPAPISQKLSIPLRLAPGNAADQPELWVLRGDGIERLDALVRDADDRLTEQLTFAVATGPDGAKSVILRTRPSRKSPPVIAFDGAVGFKPYWKLPNLYLPAGTRLQPTIRRDAVRRLLADDTDTLVWLFPHADGTFAPESVPENSFRPLADWVEYVIDSNREPLAAWVAATEFDFDHFVCSDSAPPRPKAPPEKAPKGKDRGSTLLKPASPKDPGKPPTGDAAPPPTAYEVPPIEVKPPGEWKLRLDELEKEFFAADGPLDSLERTRLWPELARANAGVGDGKRDDAAVCFVNAMWGHDAPPPALVAGWLRSELSGGKATVAAAEFDQRMKPRDPGVVEMRAFAASFLAAAYHRPVPDWLPARLPAVQKYLEAHEDKLPIRAAWLAAVRLAELARDDAGQHADVLGLARARDRLLRRLLDHGLSPERDLPGFLRFAGHKDSDRLRVVREKAREIHRVARAWVEKSLKSGDSLTHSDTTTTCAYLDLMFAFGFAKLGETTAARELVAAARTTLTDMKLPPLPNEKEDPAPFVRALVSPLLFVAYENRVQQACLGMSHATPQPSAFLTELEAIRRKKEEYKLRKEETNQTAYLNPFGSAEYAISRLQAESAILEPHERLDPYADAKVGKNPILLELASLPRETNPARLTARIRGFLQRVETDRDASAHRISFLYTALSLAARVGETFTCELIGLVPGAFKELKSRNAAVLPSDTAQMQAQFFERATFLAAHFDRIDMVRSLVDQFVGYVRSQPEEQRFELVNIVASQCVRSLRKLGLRDEVDRLLRRLQDDVLNGRSVPQLRQQYAAKPNLWADVLTTLLNLAGGWLSFGLLDQALPILEVARQEIVSGMPKVQLLKFTKLSQIYIASLGYGPAEFALPRIIDFFEKIDPARVTNTFTTNPCYSRLHLNLVEEVVLAIVSDDSALGQAGRRWLDEDEFLVRRRIHRDMRRHLEAGGLQDRK